MRTGLFATTALAVVLSLGTVPAGVAFAQEARQPLTVFNPEAQPFEAQNGYYSASPDQILASDLIGKTVYSSAGDDAETIGDINDVIMNQRGNAQAVIIGVGGFLGLGEKDVAVDFSQFNWQTDANGERVLTTALNKESLEDAPAFDYAALEREYNRLTYGTRDDRMAAGEQRDAQPMAGGQTTVVTPQPMDNQAGNNQATQPSGSQVGEATQPRQQAGQAGNQPVDNQQAANRPAEGQTNQQQMAQQQAPAGTTGQAGTNATMDRNSMQIVEMQEITAERVTGAAVYSADNENIGEVSEVLLTTDGQVSGFVVDIGGFLGMGERSVELQADQMQFSQDEDGNLAIWTEMTREQLEQIPERRS